MSVLFLSLLFVVVFVVGFLVFLLAFFDYYVGSIGFGEADLMVLF